MSRLALVAMAIATVMLSGACRGPQTPPTRTGALPYPSIFYTSVDPDDLGEHRFGGLSLQERGRGLIYSERGGLIDLAHVRIIADWTWYYYRHLHAALDAGDAELTLGMNKGSRMDLTFHYGDDWPTLAADEDADVVHKLSLAIAKELAWIMGAWHEIATWYGYSRFILGSEEPSAFTHDDTFSHLVGLRVVERAINNRELDYNEAMTQELASELAYWEAVGPDETDAAVQRVRGRWWDERGAIRRYLELSLDDQPQRAWLVPEEPGEPGHLGEPYDIPRLGEIAGRDFSGFYSVSIRPYILQANQIRRAAGIESGPIEPFEHFPAIMESIRVELLERYGPDADQP